MKEAQKPDTANYRTFNEFSVRPLRDEARSINTDLDVLVVPADDAISRLGRTEGDKILQTKDHDYNPEAPLTGNYLMAGLFRSDTSVITHLSLRDYHRIRAPHDGILREMIYVPGDLFSVNYLTAQNVPNLFARNERAICLFNTEFDPVAQILVSVTIVSSIEVAQAGVITPPRGDIIRRWVWPIGGSDGSVVLLKSQEMGHFKPDSTVINLFAPGKVDLVEQLESLSVTKIGQSLAVSAETFITPDAEPTPFPAEETEAEHGVSPLADDRGDRV